MRAAVCTAYGPPEVLQVREVSEPRPGRGEVRIRVIATAVTTSDVRIRGLVFPVQYQVALRLLYGLRAPRVVLGMIAAGVVDSVGLGVTALREGDAVFGSGGFRFGAYAEKLCWPAGRFAPRPVNLAFAEAAALPYGGQIASHFLRKLGVRKGQRVLIYGASGAIGTSAVQLAKHMGASVAGVCSGTNADLVRSLGASAVIDYTKEDFTQRGERYDVVFDAVGRRKSASAMAGSAAALAPGGVAMSVDDAMPAMLTSDLFVLKELAESRELRPVIDRTYELDEIVEAHRYVDQGHKKGNVIVKMAAEA